MRCTACSRTSSIRMLSRHERAARLRGVSVAVQRALGARALGVRALRQAPSDRRADAPALSTRIKKCAHVQSGLRAHRVHRGGARSTCRGTRCPRAPSRGRRARSRTEALEQYHANVREVPPRYNDVVLRAHLGRRIPGRLLRIPLGRGARSRRVCVVHRERRPDAGERPALSRLILSRGGTQDAAALYRNFRGRDPSVEPLLVERGLTSESRATMIGGVT